MNEILDVLKLLKQNYLMFIGAKSLNRLAMFISGYAYCIYRNEGKELIEFFSRTDEEAFDTFYRLLDEFLEQNSNYTKMKNI